MRNSGIFTKTYRVYVTKIAIVLLFCHRWSKSMNNSIKRNAGFV